jgi:hypothetical protein
MNARSGIQIALIEKLKQIDGTGTYKSNIYSNAYATLKFWDEVNDFPSIYSTNGMETRDYLPSAFKWGYLNISLKLYTRSETASEDLESLIEDVEKVIDANRTLVYNSETGARTTEILISSIVTDEGLLKPFAIGEINLQVRYQVE